MRDRDRCCWWSHPRGTPKLTADDDRAVRCTGKAVLTLDSGGYVYCARHAVAAKHLAGVARAGKLRRRTS